MVRTMGIWEKIRPKKKGHDLGASAYATFTEQGPVFTEYTGNAYGQELSRACIDRFALACSKASPEINGGAHPKVNSLFRTQPNFMNTWGKFIYLVATRTECDSTAFVVPSYDEAGNKDGLYSVKAADAEVVEYAGEPWFRFYSYTGDTVYYPFYDVCVLTRFQYGSDVMGTGNGLSETMKLVHSQSEAQEYAIKNGAAIRFVGKVSGQMRDEDLQKKRDLFVKQNLSAENQSGMMVYDATFEDVKQITPQSYVIDADEMQRIEDNVLNYFGCNKAILQNSYDEDGWAAYYEGKVEPFLIQLGEELTSMLFTPREQKAGNQVSFSSNRLEYASNASKRNMIKDMVDRGILTVNQALSILQLPPIEGGDVYRVRGEYVTLDMAGNVLYTAGGQSVPESEAHDKDAKDSDAERKSYDDENADANDKDVSS